MTRKGHRRNVHRQRSQRRLFSAGTGAPIPQWADDGAAGKADQALTAALVIAEPPPPRRFGAA